MSESLITAPTISVPRAVPLALALFASACSAEGNRHVTVQDVGGEGATSVLAEIWVDNYFELHVNGEPVAIDSVAYNTERSFNADRITFNADLPMTVALELRDFMENDTGLEYIGSKRQQMGDGGAIFQFSAGDQLLGASNADWRCTVVHHAPVDTACADLDDPTVGEGQCAADIAELPSNWTAVDFDDSAWQATVEHSAAAVSPKMGYDGIDWSPAASLIWSDSLHQDNIVLCRATLGG